MLDCEPSTRTQDDPARAVSHLPSLGAVVAERYRLTRVIGRGGMGTVYEAESLSVGRRCAVKFLRAELAGRSRSTSRFEREAHMLARLEHEHVTGVFDCGWFEDETPFFVMEYLDGETLRQVLKRTRTLSLGLSLELLKQACRGMAHAHGKGIVHRDLKPDNLMLIRHSDGRPWLKILDFGVARYLEGTALQLTPTGAELGTAEYMSPEQARGVTDVDARADVYALGAILYEVLTGCRAYGGTSYNEVLFNVITQAHAPLSEVLPGCPRALVDLVERCLSKDPAARPRDGSELLSALEAIELPEDASAGFPSASGAAADGFATTPPVVLSITSPGSWSRLVWTSASLSLGIVLGLLVARVGASRAQPASADPAASSQRNEVVLPVASCPPPSSTSTSVSPAVMAGPSSEVVPSREGASSRPKAVPARSPTRARSASKPASPRTEPAVSSSAPDAAWPGLPFATDNPYPSP